MSLADEINAIVAVPSPRCRTCIWYAQQDADTQTAFDDYLSRQDPTNPAYKPLWELCSRHGLDISSKAFRDHIDAHHKAAS